MIQAIYNNMNLSDISRETRSVEEEITEMLTPVTAFNNQTNESKNRPSRWMILTGLTVCFVTIFFGILGNTVTIAAYKRNRKLQSSFNHLITCLCAVNLVFATLVLPSILPFLFTAHNFYPNDLCSVIGYCSSSMASSSVVNLVFIAINRFIGIVHSSRYQHFFSKDIIKWWVIVVWISAPSFYLPFLLNGSYQWHEDSLNCVLPKKFNNTFWDIYKSAMDLVFLFVPVIILAILYRAILLKVKKSRKSVEHYPSPVSCSPSILEMGVGTRVTRERFSAIRRQNSSIRRKIDKLPSSPAITPSCDRRKSGLMAYLQVPPSKQTPMQDRKHSHWGDVTTRSVDMTQSSPDLRENNGKRDSIIRQSGIDQEALPALSLQRRSWGEALDLEPKPLLTSERPRKRISKEMKDLQIMSTIESEPTTSKNISTDHNDEEQDVRNEKVVYRRSLKSRSEQKKITTAKSFENQLQEIKLPHKLIKTTPSRDINSPAGNNEPTENKLVGPKKRKTFKNCDVRRSGHRASLNVEKQIRRHSTSTCSDSRVIDRSDYGNEEYRIRRVRRSLKGWRWKREKYINSAKYQQRTSLTKGNKFGSRRVKSEGSQIFRKSWKRTSVKRTDSTNIKIVIEQATSEDSEEESGNQEEENFSKSKIVKKQLDEFLKDKNENNEFKKPCSDSNSNCCKSLISKMLHNSRETKQQHHDSQVISPSMSSLRKSADCSDAIPNVQVSSPTLLVQNDEFKSNQTLGLSPSIQTNMIFSFQNNNPMTSFPANLSAAFDLAVESSELTTSDDRRSSVTSHVYRYTAGGEDCLSRQGSFSCVSCADDYVRSRNSSCRVSREYGTPMLGRKNKLGESSRRSIYKGWRRRKSIYASSVNSSASSERGRKRRRKEAEKHLAYNGFIICAAFSLCVLPTYAISCINSFTNIPIGADVIFAISMLSWLPIVINPLIYGVLNPQYRLEYRRMIRTYRRWWRTRFRCCYYDDTRSESEIVSSRQSRLWRYASAWESKSSRPPID